MKYLKEELNVKGGKTFVFFNHNLEKFDIKMNDPIILKYSGLKMGKLTDIKSCAEEICLSIKENIPELNKKDWLITNCPSFMNYNAAKFLTEEISKKIGIEYILLNKKSPKTTEFYLDVSDKKKEELLENMLEYKGKDLKNKNVILIDDGLATGSILKKTIELLLSKKVSKIESFVYLKMNKDLKNIEREIGKLIFYQKGIKEIGKIFNKKENIPVTSALSVILDLSKEELMEFFSILKKEKAENITDLLLKYYPRRSPESNKFHDLISTF